MTVRDLIRRRDTSDLRIDLLVGCFIGWLGATWITHKDPRYSLPDLVYIAVLGGGWIATLARGRIRVVLTCLLAGIAAVNLIGVSFGLGSTHQTALPGHTAGRLERLVTYYSPTGYLDGGPEVDGNVPSLTRELKRSGYRNMTVQVAGAGAYDFNQSGLDALAGMIGLDQTPVFEPSHLGPHGFMFELVMPKTGEAASLQDARRRRRRLRCRRRCFGAVRRSPLLLPRAPSRLLRSHGPAEPRTGGAHRVEPPTALAHPLRLAVPGHAQAGDHGAAGRHRELERPVLRGRPDAQAGQRRGPHRPAVRTRHPQHARGVSPRHPDGAGEPPACLQFADGTGLDVVLGYAYIPFANYEFDCPTRTPK